ncbi:MAG: glutaredoxin [Candidatus Marinimicrobia bacterium]|nr:glutaredoxin [Candidatus Neomarinimicrobiota bacterium]MBL7022945.1 glutaredoxin [Candidatus Neomarinimicrobiota bacterium]MBL7108763.1 glutaredoxin [Candidatus Neomarinimicrobiota bacterium]
MIKIYSTDWCPYCVNAKQYFAEHNLDFEEVNIEQEEMSRQELAEITGGSSVPQIVINDKPIGGYTDLMALHHSGRLQEMLKE